MYMPTFPLTVRVPRVRSSFVGHSIIPISYPSAESSDIFWHDQMHFTFTVIVGIDPRFEFVGTQQPVWFRHRPLAMDPFRFYGVQPRAFAGQLADHNTHALGTPLDLLIVLTDPVPHGMTAVPG